MTEGKLVEDKVIVWNIEEGKEVYETGYYGKLKEDRLELALIEACLLLERQKIDILDENEKKMKFEKFFHYCCKIDKRFVSRYVVYKDLRERGLPVRTGFKFGCDFRVYERGVKPIKRGPKAPGEHTKWIVFAVSEDYTCSFHELSRAVRLAHNIRANMLWAIVDADLDVTYYTVTFTRP